MPRALRRRGDAAAPAVFVLLTAPFFFEAEYATKDPSRENLHVAPLWKDAVVTIAKCPLRSEGVHISSICGGVVSAP